MIKPHIDTSFANFDDAIVLAVQQNSSPNLRFDEDRLAISRTELTLHHLQLKIHEPKEKSLGRSLLLRDCFRGGRRYQIPIRDGAEPSFSATLFACVNSSR